MTKSPASKRIRRIGEPAPCTADYALLALVVSLAVILFAAMAGVELVRAVLSMSNVYHWK